MKNQKNFRSTQRELFAVCYAGWESCRQNLADFAKFRPVYSDGYLSDRLKEVAAVSEMPDRHGRSYKQDITRIELKDAHANCLDAWKKLKLAITSIWPENKHEAAFKGIGQDLYADSARMRWESCTAMLDRALAFLTDNAETVAASNMLGPNFTEEFKALADGFKTQLQKYVARLNEESELADAKLQACNKLYKDLLLMFADARIIFKNNPVKLKRFSFEVQLDLVSGQNSAGIRGTITNGQVPVSNIPDLVLSLAESDDEAYVDENGSYRFSQMAAGTYTLLVKAGGYKEQHIPNIVVNTGSYTTQNITLEKETIENK